MLLSTQLFWSEEKFMTIVESNLLISNFQPALGNHGQYILWTKRRHPSVLCLLNKDLSRKQLQIYTNFCNMYTDLFLKKIYADAYLDTHFINTHRYLPVDRCIDRNVDRKLERKP